MFTAVIITKKMFLFPGTLRAFFSFLKTKPAECILACCGLVSSCQGCLNLLGLVKFDTSNIKVFVFLMQ